MTEQDPITPTEIRAPRGARQMEIDWADGHTSLLPHTVLRGFCPCAHCQGHDGPIRFRPPEAREAAEPDPHELADLEPVGNYAVRLVWGDGHGTGIYSFRYLRQLCQCREHASSQGPEERTYPR